MSPVRRAWLGLSLVAVGFAVRLPGQTYRKVLAVPNDQRVYAYARISHSGRFLVYTANRSGSPTIWQPTLRVVSLKTGRIIFEQNGLDGFWSPDDRKIIFISWAGPQPQVAIADTKSWAVTKDVAPVTLGDYLSWASVRGRDLIMTIQGQSYWLVKGRAVLPSDSLQPCPGIGTGQRPLMSRDGSKVTVFADGRVFVRPRVGCNGIVDTGLRGAKADISWDGRYVALHALKADSSAYQIYVIDLRRRTQRLLSPGPGSSYYPSWTNDGRLCFRQDGPDYKGFILADHVLDATETPLPHDIKPDRLLSWAKLFPSDGPPVRGLSVVVMWSSWNVHSAEALRAGALACRRLHAAGIDVGVYEAPEIDSARNPLPLAAPDSRLIGRLSVDPSMLGFTPAVNQMPSVLVFSAERLIGEKFGSISADQLVAWIDGLSLGRDSGR